jgi:hypothetical protein
MSPDTAAVIGSATIAQPASAAPPSKCTENGWPNGREVYADNANNGGGAMTVATLCWSRQSNGYYRTWVTYTVWDITANGAGATIRMEWTGTDGDTHYDVPNNRAWVEGSSATGSWALSNIKDLYVRACLTNTNSEAHHCGPKV